MAVATPALGPVDLSRVTVRLPGLAEPVEDVVLRAGHTARDARIFKALGLRTTRSLAEGERMEELLLDAACAALDGAPAGLVLYAHTLMMRRIELYGGLRDTLRDKVAGPDGRVFGISHINCVGALRSIELARRYLARRESGPDDRVLLLTGEQGSVNPYARVFPGRSISGDCVAAVVLQRPGDGARPRYRYLGGAASRDARFHRNIRMTEAEIATNTEVIRAQTLDVVRRAADAAGVGLDRIDWVMPHLSNRMVWTHFCAHSGYPFERICLDLLPERGHNFGADELMALEHADGAGRLRPGDVCALVASGRGAYFQSVIVEVLEDAS